MSMSKVGYIIAGALLALVVVFGAVATFAQSDAAPAVVQSVVGADATGLMANGVRALAGRGDVDRSAGNEALAEALGITVEELEMAQQSAKEAALADAVAAGALTQEDADAILEGGRFRGRIPFHTTNEEGLTYLADALDITVDELQAAMTEVMVARLDEAVAEGRITREEADMLLARHEVHSRIDRESIEAAMTAALEAAVDEALEAGAITQAQADEILSEGLNSFGRRGHRGPHGRGFGPGQRGPAPGGAAPVTPDSDA